MSNNKADIKQTGSRSVKETSFEGMLLFELNQFEDKRGSFTELWQTEEMQKLGLPDVNPKQVGISKSNKGTIRAVHAEPYDKIISPIEGEIFVAMVDLRTDSETFGKVDSFQMDSTQMLFIPKGIGNSFQALSDKVIYCYCVTGLWSSEKAYSGGYVAVHYADPDLNIDWPIGPENQIVSMKDQNNPTMREAFPDKYS